LKVVELLVTGPSENTEPLLAIDFSVMIGVTFSRTPRLYMLKDLKAPSPARVRLLEPTYQYVQVLLVVAHCCYVDERRVILVCMIRQPSLPDVLVSSYSVI
jgi:hypothetical protein